VGLPVLSPAVICFFLYLIFKENQSADPLARAIISVSGSGDLLIFSALLLINVGAKFRTIELPRRSKRDYESGDIDPDKPFFCAFFMLVIYSITRVVLETMQFPDDVTIRFVYGIASVIILAIVFLWIDNLVCSMHTKQLRRRLNLGLIESQYNM
jgi:hypothetical protein